MWKTENFGIQRNAASHGGHIFFQRFILTGGWLLHSSVLFSAVHQTRISHRSACVPSLSNSLPLLPTLLRRHRAPIWAPCLIQQIPIGCLLYIWHRIHFNATLSNHPTFLFPHCVASVLCLCLLCCPENTIVSTFWISYICINICFSLSHFILNDRLQVHPSH